MTQNNFSDQYLLKAEKISNILGNIPFIKLIAVTGSVASKLARDDSDIDLFIIAKNKRIWTTRFFLVLALKFWGQYRSGNRINQKAGKICPNRYVTDEYLLINPQNSYHAKEYSQIIPIYAEGYAYNNFFHKNAWMKKYCFNKVYKIQKNNMSRVKKIAEWVLSGFLGNIFEKLFKTIQLKSIMRDSRVNKSNSGLFVSDDELRFHPNPR
jgi:predicted nucleotidyltransferase